VLLLQLFNLVGDVALENGRVIPRRLGQSRGDDVLWHGVELVRELAVPGWPGCGKALIGHAPEQQGLGRPGFVELDFVALISAAELEAPACVLETLASARGLDDPVK